MDNKIVDSTWINKEYKKTPSIDSQGNDIDGSFSVPEYQVIVTHIHNDGLRLIDRIGQYHLRERVE